MKKVITLTEYNERRKKEQEDLAKAGIVDFQEERIKRMWDDPNVPDEHIPYVEFTFSSESGDFIFVQEKPNGDRDDEA